MEISVIASPVTIARVVANPQKEKTLHFLKSTGFLTNQIKTYFYKIKPVLRIVIRYSNEPLLQLKHHQFQELSSSLIPNLYD